MRCESMNRFGKNVRCLEFRRAGAEEVVLIAGGQGEVGEDCGFEASLRHQPILSARDDVADSHRLGRSKLIRRLDVWIEEVRRRETPGRQDHKSMREDLEVVPNV